MLNANGAMGDMDDGPGQVPLEDQEVMKIILELLPSQSFDLVITHDPSGEYTRHRRHEETGRAVISLWNKNEIKTTELWTFAYEDGGKMYFPKVIESASFLEPLPEKTWKMKFKFITEIYGFEPGGFEAETTPKTEAFWRFKKPGDALKWLKRSQSKS